MSNKLTLAVSNHFCFGSTGILWSQHKSSSSQVLKVDQFVLQLLVTTVCSVPNRNRRHDRASIVHQRSSWSERNGLEPMKSGSTQNSHLNQRLAEKQDKVVQVQKGIQFFGHSTVYIYDVKWLKKTVKIPKLARLGGSQQILDKFPNLTVF